METPGRVFKEIRKRIISKTIMQIVVFINFKYAKNHIEALRMISCQTLFTLFPSIMVVRLPHSPIL
jgi:hypothetical protein